MPHRARVPIAPGPAGAECAEAPVADVRDRVFDGTDLANVDARGGQVRRCLLRGVRLTGATLTEASVQDVTVRDARADLVSLAGATLERVVFADCDLRETAFDHARLHDVRFERCALDRASFDGVRLQRVELVGCDLAGVRSVADLRGASMPWPDMVGNAGALATAAGIHLLDEEQRPPP